MSHQQTEKSRPSSCLRPEKRRGKDLGDCSDVRDLRGAGMRTGKETHCWRSFIPPNCARIIGVRRCMVEAKTESVEPGGDGFEHGIGYGIVSQPASMSS